MAYYRDLLDAFRQLGAQMAQILSGKTPQRCHSDNRQISGCRSIRKLRRELEFLYPQRCSPPPMK